MASVQLLQKLLEAALPGQGDTDIRRQCGQACTFFDQSPRPLPLSDVLRLRDKLERLTDIVMRAGHAEQNPDALPVFAEVPFLYAEGGKILGQHPTEEGEVGFKVVGVSDVLEGPLEQFLLGVSGDLTEGVVDLEPAPLRRHQGHADGSVIKRIAETILGLAK